MSLLEKLSLKSSNNKPDRYSSDTYTTVPPPEQSGLISNGQAPPSYAQPPSYQPIDPANNADVPSADELSAAFISLKLGDTPLPFPEADQCLAHLKLLSAFHGLKEDIGYTDGLFGLWDSKCEIAGDRDQALAKMREKRWALYIARAVERFEDWWLQVLCNMEECRRLEGKEMVASVLKFTDFTKRGRVKQWTTTMLPPIGMIPSSNHPDITNN